MTHVGLALFGTFEVTRDGQPVTSALSAKGRALLAYLAVEAARPHAREVLAELLWPDHGPQVARDSLREALSRLRLALGERTAAVPLLLITRETVQVNAAGDFTLDVAVFAALRAACAAHPHPRIDRCGPCMRRLAQVTALYRGDFLQQFTLGDSAAFEEWAALQRERLRSQALETLGHLAAYHEHRGDYAHALAYAERQVALDPWQEDAHRQVLRLLAYRGQRGAALEQYERCRRILAEDLGVDPAAETTALAAQIRAGSLPQPPPAARTAQLPAQLTSFIGREEEWTALARRMEDPEWRLVTLTGPGGVGKTRLALQVAGDLQDDFADGVWFVNLAPLRDPTLVASAIAHTLGVQEAPDQPLRTSLQDYLRGKQLLLLLDNFEQVLAAAPLVADLLAAVPHLKVLVTSRAPLHLLAEHEYPVPPLALPEPQHVTDLAGLAQSEAVALFIHHAQAVKPDFQLTHANAPALAEICMRLDGLPLAIQLAAARSKLLAPQAILARLQHRLRFLTGGARDLPARQQTLRSTLDWSYQLLDAGEQILFARLGVFVGGCTLEAIEAVCNAQGELPGDVLDGVQSLLDKSLAVQADGPGGDPRVTMLETIREYALEQLEASEEADILQRRHATYYLMLAERVNLDLQGAQQKLALDRLEQEHANLRVALQWVLQADDVETAARLLGALGVFWFMHGHLREGFAWTEQVLARSAALPPHLRASVLARAAVLADRQGERKRAITLSVESLALYRAVENTQGIAAQLVSLGTFASEEGDFVRANADYEESIRLYGEVADSYGLARALDVFGYAVNCQGDHVRAEVLHNKSLALRRTLGDNWGIAFSLNSLGHVLLNRGDYCQAHDRYTDSLALRRALGDMRGVARSLANLANVTLGQGAYRRAAALNAESLALAQQVGDQHAIAVALSQLGLVLLAQGDLRNASRRLSESLTLWWKFHDTRAIALCIEGMAAAAIIAGDAARAVRLWASAAALRERNQVPWSPFDRLQLEQYGTMIRSRLDPATFAAAWAEGQAMTLEQAFAYALEETVT